MTDIIIVAVYALLSVKTRNLGLIFCAITVTISPILAEVMHHTQLPAWAWYATEGWTSAACAAVLMLSSKTAKTVAAAWLAAAFLALVAGVLEASSIALSGTWLYTIYTPAIIAMHCLIFWTLSEGWRRDAIAFFKSIYRYIVSRRDICLSWLVYMAASSAIKGASWRH